MDDILREWHELCESAYVNDVPLKLHAAEYLKKLRGEGVRLAVATALPKRLYRPVLLRTGVLSLFDAFASTDEAGESKRSGDVYRLAARRLGVEPAECVVFEDILDGLLGAKAAGMKAVLVRDPAAAGERERALTVCDAAIDGFGDWL